MNGVDDLLAPYVAAWRADSLSPLSPRARERARAAMLAAVAASDGRRYRGRGVAFRVRLGRRRGPQRLAGALVTLTAAVVLGLLGWNAPAGSPLHGVRVVRQSVQLAVPGADLPALHLQFAEQSLADARNALNSAASLADARAELDAAHGLLPADHS